MTAPTDIPPERVDEYEERVGILMECGEWSEEEAEARAKEEILERMGRSEG